MLGFMASGLKCYLFENHWTIGWISHLMPRKSLGFQLRPSHSAWWEAARSKSEREMAAQCSANTRPSRNQLGFGQEPVAIGWDYGMIMG